MATSARLQEIRRRILLLAALDENRQVFGASSHDYTLAPVLTADAVTAFERANGVTLPDQLRGFVSVVASAGAGPYYGLLPLPEASGTDGSPLARPFDPAAALHTPSAFDGQLRLAEQGCGYRSVLLLSGPRRGEIVSDMREAAEGFQPEAASLLDWYEEWLDHAMAEWAKLTLPGLLARRGAVVAEGLAEVEPILERLAARTTPTPGEVLYPVSRCERLGTLTLLRIHQGRFDEALALATEARGLETDEAAARFALARARIANARGDAAAAVAAVTDGLADPQLWFATRWMLGAERERALLALGRRDEAVQAKLERARGSRVTFTFYDVVCMHITDRKLDAAAEVLLELAEAAIDCDRELSLGERAVASSQMLFEALAGSEPDAVVDDVRARLSALAATAGKRPAPG